MSRLPELRELTRIRVLTFLREPEAIFWVFVFPLVLTAVLGLAFRSSTPAPSPIAVVGEREALAPLLDTLTAGEDLEIELFETHDDAFLKLRKGAVDALIEPGDPPTLTFDEQRAEAETARLRVLRALELADRAAPPDPPLELHPVSEVGSRYVDFLFPGILGMNLMGTGMWGVGFAIADIRRRNFLRRLMVTPMRKSSFFLSFMLSRLVFLVLELTVLVAFGAWVLGVPFRGDAVSFALVALLGAVVFAGLGILTVSRTQTIEGASGLMNFVMVPMWLGSGIFFSYERFPDILHPILRLLPLTALNDALRAVMLDGETIFAQGPELAVLAAWCLASFVIALRIFRWE